MEHATPEESITAGKQVGLIVSSVAPARPAGHPRADLGTVRRLHHHHAARQAADARRLRQRRARKRAYLEPVVVGDVLPDMPLCLTPEYYVNVPLETTYRTAYDAVPRRWRDVLDGLA